MTIPHTHTNTHTCQPAHRGETHIQHTWIHTQSLLVLTRFDCTLTCQMVHTGAILNLYSYETFPRIRY